VRCLGAEELVDHDPAALVRGEAGRAEAEQFARALAARGVHDGVGGDLLPALQDRDGTFWPGLDRGHGLAEPEGDREVTQVVFERLDHFDVAELQHPLAPLHHRDLGAQRREHGRVLDPDDPRARDDHRPRDLLQLDDPVGIHDGALVELDALGPGGPGTGGDHDLLGRGRAQLAAAAVDLHCVRVGEVGGAGQHRDPVPGQLAADHVHLPADHVAGAGGQVGDGDLILDPVALPVHLPLF
jgi:hypothetical protein